MAAEAFWAQAECGDGPATYEAPSRYGAVYDILQSAFPSTHSTAMT
jgi:hypothetical protein